MGRILPRHVTLSITAGDGTPIRGVGARGGSGVVGVREVGVWGVMEEVDVKGGERSDRNVERDFQYVVSPAVKALGDVTQGYRKCLFTQHAPCFHGSQTEEEGESWTPSRAGDAQLYPAHAAGPCVTAHTTEHSRTHYRTL